MKLSLVLSALFLLDLFFFACQKKSIESGIPPVVITPGANKVVELEDKRLSAIVSKESVKTWLSGFIIDEQSVPLAGAQVSCGDLLVTTDNKGFFWFPSILTVNKEFVLIAVKKQGYMNGFRTFTPNPAKLAYHTETITLQSAKISQAIPVDGGTVTIDSIRLGFTAGSLLTTNGIVYAGNVRVKARYINPSSSRFPELVPGTLQGIDTSGNFTGLQSFGMANMELLDEAGQPLQVANGKSVDVELPATPAGPPAIPLWHFNENYGLWVLQGEAKKQGAVYKAEINHFSAWNIDGYFTSSFNSLQLHFQNASGNALPNLKIWLEVDNYSFNKLVFTDNFGDLAMVRCPENYAMTLRVLVPCDTIDVRIPVVRPSRSDIIVLDDPKFKNYDFAGSLYSCNNIPLKDHPFQIYLNGTTTQEFKVINGITDNEGNFQVSTFIHEACQVSGLKAEAMTMLDNQFKFSQPIDVVPGMNLYSPSVCYSIPTGNQPFNDSDIVEIPDPNFRKCIEHYLSISRGTVYYKDVKNKTSVLFIDRMSSYADTVQSIMGIQYFTGLKGFLMAHQGTISDLHPLENLTQLEQLDLRNTGVADISPLRKLVHLQTLKIAGNNIADITPLSDMTGLTELDISSNINIADISPVRNNRKLKIFLFVIGSVADVSILSGMPDLEDLEFSQNQVSDISAVSNLKKLVTFSASYNKISDISPLQQADSLNYVGLNSNQITDISPLAGKLNIETLSLKDNQITDVTPIQTLKHIVQVWLNNNQIISLQPLIDPNTCRGLYTFGISGNPYSTTDLVQFSRNHPLCGVEK